MKKLSALLAICAGNSPVTGEFPTQRPVTRSFDIFFDLCLNKRLSKQSWGWWFETLSCTLWRHCNDCLIVLRLKKNRCYIHIHHTSKFENTEHQLPWNISSQMIIMKFILPYSKLESLYKVNPNRNCVWRHNFINEISTHLGKTPCMVAAANIFTSNYSVNLSGVCT